jgi:hypothetical protein
MSTIGLDSLSPPRSNIVANLLQSISAAGSSVSPRLRDAQGSSKADPHRYGAATSATGTLLPFSSGWGALHPTVEVKQRPAAVLRASNANISQFARISAEMSRRAWASVSERGFGRSISPKKSLEVPACVQCQMKNCFSCVHTNVAYDHLLGHLEHAARLP